MRRGVGATAPLLGDFPGRRYNTPPQRPYDKLVLSLPVNVAGHPPAPVLVLHAFGLTTVARAAALCIGCAALTAPLTYALGRSLGTDRDARVAAVLAACSPAMLLFGVTSFRR